MAPVEVVPTRFPPQEKQQAHTHLFGNGPDGPEKMLDYPPTATNTKVKMKRSGQKANSLTGYTTVRTMYLEPSETLLMHDG